MDKINEIKIGIIIPDRGDRPKFLENCKRMIAAQSLQPCSVAVINFVPEKNEIDITKRYRIGYDLLRNNGLDIIALIENDDWYHPCYLETMVAAWINCGKPSLLGTSYTVYYHLKLRAYFTMYHSTRASAMNTLIVPDLKFDWCADNEPYTDMHLWGKLQGIVIKPEKHISFGIKHGEGLCGGHMHNDRLHRYDKHGTSDKDFSFLKKYMDEKSFNFYSSYYK